MRRPAPRLRNAAGIFLIFAQITGMRLSCIVCSAMLAFLAACGGVYALTGFDALRFVCFGSRAAARCAAAAGGACALFFVYALCVLKPFRGMK